MEQSTQQNVTRVEFDGEAWLRLDDVNRLDPFFISVVSNSDVWLFAGSNGPFVAGRVEPDQALFPYETVDKILRHPDSSGARTIIAVEENGVRTVWEPWQDSHPGPDVSRHLYKHVYGTDLVFEEEHAALGLIFRTRLSVCQEFGVVRRCELENLTEKDRNVECLDGFHRLIPPGVNRELSARYSYLIEAYMRHEAIEPEGLRIFTLNAGITDQADPSESLWAAVGWTVGRPDAVRLLSDNQVDAFRCGDAVKPEPEVRGVSGACLDAGSISLNLSGKSHWYTVVDTRLDHAAVWRLKEQLGKPEEMEAVLEMAVQENRNGLRNRIADADGIQITGISGEPEHHFANVLFNVMRGGTFEGGYAFPKYDLEAFLGSRSKTLFENQSEKLAGMPNRLSVQDLQDWMSVETCPDTRRLLGEYLPLTFSRRHGDPSRPWNQFAIHLQDEEGRPAYGYQGNWRDIFQNWEALAQSYPDWFPSMIKVFLNASTADGYNPYRIFRSGVDWEVPDPDDPWAHIGYWGDHQIIYLLRLLEGAERFQPGQLAAQVNVEDFVCVDVPYRIKTFDKVERDPKHSIEFDRSRHESLISKEELLGGDGRLLVDASGLTQRMSLGAKLLVPLLAKLGNLVPQGGIWLSTQRPEWNDANNALAGLGLSVVTTAYLYRYACFLRSIINDTKTLVLPEALWVWLDESLEVLAEQGGVEAEDSDARYRFVAAMGRAGDRYRQALYNGSMGVSEERSVDLVRSLLDRTAALCAETVRVNQRGDGLYHSYNLLNLDKAGCAEVSYLDLMLEGQVAVLSSGMLTSATAADVLKALRDSDLYREDQHSYILYPDREMKPFLDRNTLPADAYSRSPLIEELAESLSSKILCRGPSGSLHFHADLCNRGDLDARLEKLNIQEGREVLQQLWEEVFVHREFTGRSGTMFGFEGLGSIYWHMVSKLLLSAQECALSAETDDLRSRLWTAYFDVRAGLGFSKSPAEYGAFPSDPYSHTPAHRGAQQPGMTGQVKEEVLTRMGELGVLIESGQIGFSPERLRNSEFLSEDQVLQMPGNAAIPIPSGALAFTVCGVPVIYTQGDVSQLKLTCKNRETTREELILTQEESRQVFGRTGELECIEVVLDKQFFSQSS